MNIRSQLDLTILVKFHYINIQQLLKIKAITNLVVILLMLHVVDSHQKIISYTQLVEKINVYFNGMSKLILKIKDQTHQLKKSMKEKQKTILTMKILMNQMMKKKNKMNQKKKSIQTKMILQEFMVIMLIKNQRKLKLEKLKELNHLMMMLSLIKKK